MILCAAQFQSRAGDVAGNMERHLVWAARASDAGADLILFPELSLTGYEPALGGELAMAPDDPQLSALQALSRDLNIVIGVGLPLAGSDGVMIGALFFTPEGLPLAYGKQILHPDETPHFQPGRVPLVLDADSHRLALGICYETLQLPHAEKAAGLGADIYLASVAKHEAGVGRGHIHYPIVAQGFGMDVMMVNAVGPNDGFVSAGGTAYWDRQGNMAARLDREREGMLMVDTAAGSARALYPFS